jgi:ATP-binding cassette subfamily C protein CydD
MEPITPVEGFFLLLLAPEAFMALRKLALNYHFKAEADAVADSVKHTPYGAAGRAEESPGAQESREALREPPRLSFTDVTVAYPGGRRGIDGVSFTVPAGAGMAIVGPSGSGKTTLLDVLLGFVRVNSGQVLVDGQGLETLGPETLARSAAYVGRHVHVFPGSVADALRLASPQADDSDLETVLREVGLWSTLAPRGGLDADVGEEGRELSGGELRRLGLARALLKPAPLVLMDEPTASLDAETEERMLSLIARACHGRTALIATHSPALAERADARLHLVEGRIEGQS